MAVVETCHKYLGQYKESKYNLQNSNKNNSNKFIIIILLLFISHKDVMFHFS